jgi:hypothetical protein
MALFPEQPAMYGFLQFVYLTNRSSGESKNNITPDFICFDAKKYPSLLSSVVQIDIIDGLTCCHISNLTEHDEIKDFFQVNNTFSHIYRQSSINQSKCILYHRVSDGFKDCYHGEVESFPAC